MTDKREIDAQIDRLKGHRVERLGDGDTSDAFRVLGVAKSFAVNDVPHYSTSIADAWILVEEMARAGLDFEIMPDNQMWFFASSIGYYCGDTAQEAICNAYLVWETYRAKEVR